MPNEAIEYGIHPPHDIIELAHSVRELIERMMVIDRPDSELDRARTEIGAAGEE